MRPSEIVNSMEESGKDALPMAISPKVKIETKVKKIATCMVSMPARLSVRWPVCPSDYPFLFFLNSFFS